MPVPPDELVEAGLPFPGIEYVSRMSLALADHQSSVFLRAVDVGVNLAQFEPTIFDNMDLGGSYRDFMRSAGLPEGRIRREEEVAMIGERRAAALAEMQVAAAPPG